MVLVHVHRFPNKQNHPRAIYQNETVGAVPMCPPERPRSGVSMPKIHALCTGNERRMRPCRATRAGTQAPPLPNFIKFSTDAEFHNRIPQNGGRMRTFTAEYPKTVGGCGLSRLNSPKRWADADFHPSKASRPCPNSPSSMHIVGCFFGRSKIYTYFCCAKMVDSTKT